MIDKLSLGSEYQTVPVLPKELYDLEHVVTNGEETVTLGIVKSYLDPSFCNDITYTKPLGPLYLLQRLPGDTKIFHGGDLKYIGRHWTFDIDTAINFMNSGYDGEHRDHPTLRIIRAGDLLEKIMEACEKKQTGLPFSASDIVGSGTTWKNLEISLKKLQTNNCEPKIEIYKK
jgi:hypothetical protein